MPNHAAARRRSLKTSHAVTATNTGVVDTSKTAAAIVVIVSDVIHVAKWMARKTPEMSGNFKLERSILRSPGRANGSSASDPAAQRQKEMASGSAASA
jgi:hypothetical protein